MSNFIKITPSEISLTPGKKVLKADDYSSYVESQELLKESEARAKAQEKKATEALSGMMEKAMHDISLKINAEKTKHILDTVQASIHNLQRMENDIANLVMSSVRKIITDYSDEERIFHAVKSGLRLIGQTQTVTIRVNPDVSGELMERLKTIEHGIKHIEIQPDEKLSHDDCILESSLGIVNANIENQINNIETAVRSSLGQ